MSFSLDFAPLRCIFNVENGEKSQNSIFIFTLNVHFSVKMTYWEKLTFSKLWFSRTENSKKCTSFEEQKVTRYILENVYFAIIVFSCLLRKKHCLRFLLICSTQEIKGSYRRSLGTEADFMDILNVSPNILAKN